jgi:hypothetical protein
MPTKSRGANQGGQGSAAAKKAAAARDRARKAAARRAKQSKKKRDCKKSVSKKQKEKLRKASPSKSATKKVNKEAKKPLKCPTCGRTSPPGFKAGSSNKKYKNLAADHIVPFDRIINMPGFACLSKRNQKKVVNNPSNFRGVCPPCNSSRQDTPWDQWKGHETFGMTPSGKKFAAEMAQKTPGLAKNLSNQIGSLL